MAIGTGPLQPLPAMPYLVTDRHLRRVGKDCLVWFEASLYSVPARRVRAGQRVEVRVSPDTITLHALPSNRSDVGEGTPGSMVLAVHARAAVRGTWVVDPTHWDALPDGHTRSTVVDFPRRGGDPLPACAADAAVTAAEPNPLQALLIRSALAATPVAKRALAAYDNAAGLTAPPASKATSTSPRPAPFTAGDLR